MKLNGILLLSLIGFKLCGAAFAEDHNRALSDAMLLIGDQVGVLGALPKQNPALIDTATFERLTARCRGAAMIFRVINEKKGAMVDGKLVVGELTPGKFLPLDGDALAAAMADFTAHLTGAEALIAKLETELNVQNGLDPAARNFRQYKLVLAQLDTALKKGHEAFKPPSPQHQR